MEALVKEALILIVAMTGIPLGVAAMSGLIISVMQTATQIQEQTITYLVKIVSFIILCIIFGKRSFSLILDLFQDAFRIIGTAVV